MTITCELLACEGSDDDIVAAAKVMDTPMGGFEDGKTAGLINFMLREKHGTPFEHAFLKFGVKAPIFVSREHFRHRIGHCVSGEAQVWTETWTPRSGRCVRRRSIAEIHERYHHGVTDVLGRTRLLPQCRDLTLRVADEESRHFKLGAMADIFESGEKETFEIVGGGKSLRASKDHRILTSDGWATIEQLSRGDRVAVSGFALYRTRTEYSVPPSLRRGIGVWTSMLRKYLISDRDRCYLCHSEFARDDLILDHVIPVAENIKRALDVDNLRPACLPCHRVKTNGEQRLADRKGNQTAGITFVPLERKPIRVAEEMTYDIEVAGPHHNFVANGFVVHNSYNEASTRYTDVREIGEPYNVADVAQRQVGKPGAYTFEDLSLEQRHAAYDIIDDVLDYVDRAYDMLRELGLGKQDAGTVLTISHQTAYIWSCNPRSLMHFLSLRNAPQARREIRMIAEQAEAAFAQRFPITHAAFVEHGRIAP